MSKTRPDILLLGETYNSQEAAMGMPFVGSAGNILNEALEEAGIARTSCHATAVLPVQPRPTNDIKNLCTTDFSEGCSHLPPLVKSPRAWLRREYEEHLENLAEEILRIDPTLIIALGPVALWYLTGSLYIRAVRGTAAESGTISSPGLAPKSFKFIPTYSPNMVLRDWAIRPLLVADLMKASRQRHFPEVRRPAREIWLEPTVAHMELFYNNYVRKSKVMAYDIETAGATQITCVGFAPDPEHAIVIPFVDNRKPGGNYWPTPEKEREAWDMVRKYLHHTDAPELELVAQNGLYDINWLWSKVGIAPRNACRDTMLKHHAMNPELEKGLGFLGSIYTDEPAWKTMRSASMFHVKRGE